MPRLPAIASALMGSGDDWLGAAGGPDLKRPMLSKSRQRRRKKACPPLSRAEELLAISQFLVTHGATRPAVYPEYDYIDFEDPRLTCEAKGYLRTDGRVSGWTGWAEQDDR